MTSKYENLFIYFVLFSNKLSKVSLYDLLLYYVFIIRFCLITNILLFTICIVALIMPRTVIEKSDTAMLVSAPGLNTGAGAAPTWRLRGNATSSMANIRTVVLQSQRE